MPKNDEEARYRGWIFTINNYTPQCIEAVKTVKCRCIKAGFEVGEKKGTPHIQGAIYFTFAKTRNAARKDLGNRASLKIMKGDWDSQDYCLKDGNIVRNEGEPPKQGQRVDLDLFHADIKSGMAEDQILATHLNVVAKYPRLEDRLKTYYAKQNTREFRKVDVYVYYGEGGAGKSRKAIYNEDGSRGDNYIVPKTENLKWFADYQQEKTIIINDFYGGCKWSRFLDLLDGHQMQVEVKGGHTYAAWTKVILTSNSHPDEWYANHNHADKEFIRRVPKENIIYCE